MSKAQNQDVYLIVCEGQGDVDVGLVNKETWDWIFSPFNSPKSSYQETIPNTIIQAYDDKHPQTTMNVTIGSYENDRALQCPKWSFSSMKEAMKFIQTNNCNLVDEYYGSIY